MSSANVNPMRLPGGLPTPPCAQSVDAIHRLHSFRLRRIMKPSPARPVAKRARVEGSGTAPDSEHSAASSRTSALEALDLDADAGHAAPVPADFMPTWIRRAGRCRVADHGAHLPDNG